MPSRGLCVSTFPDPTLEAWAAFHDRMEARCAPGEGLEHIADWAAKAPREAATINCEGSSALLHRVGV